MQRNKEEGEGEKKKKRGEMTSFFPSVHLGVLDRGRKRGEGKKKEGN